MKDCFKPTITTVKPYILIRFLLVKVQRICSLWWYGWSDFKSAILFRTDDHDMFWEILNIGWYQEYIYPYDDWYSCFISDERIIRLAEKRHKQR